MEVFGFVDHITLFSAICFILGFVFVLIEMFHPGFGAPGIAGAILLVLGIIFTAGSFLQALIMILIILAILGVILSFVLQSAAKGRLSKTLILHETQKKEEGYIGTEDLQYFLGQEGVTTSVLRPAGTADFDGVKLDVVSEAAFIPAHTKIKIVKVQGRRIVVDVVK